MENKKSKINLILSIISFSITAFLLVMISMAWYAVNKTAYVSAGIGHTKGTDYDLTLQRGVYSNGTWTWTNTNELAITNMQPGDVYFFRFKIEYDARVTFETSFSDISSSLVPDRLIARQDGLNTYVEVAGTGQHLLLVSGNSVMIEDHSGQNTVSNQLYSVSGEVVTLATTAYLVADTFKLYDYGLGTSTFSNDNVLNLTTDKKENTNTLITSSILTSSPTVRYDLTTLQDASGIAYGYFALEFNDDLSTKTYLHLDGTIGADSNLYQCQAISIGAIALRDIS